MAAPRIFLSFSSLDIQFVRRFMSRLRALRLPVWDYSVEGQEIPGGAILTDYLRAKIDQSAIFLPVVSQNAFSSRFSRAEVAYALERASRHSLRIIPLILVGQAGDAPWPPPHRDLSEYRFYSIEPTQWTSMEEAVARLCADLDVEYIPLPIGDPRLPFLDKLQDELKCHLPRHDERHNRIFFNINQARIETESALRNNDFDAALIRVNYLIVVCEYEFPGRTFYYPYIVKAVCLICLNQLLEAESMLKNLADHPLRDENLDGAMGYIRLQQGNFQEAMHHYEMARQRDPSDIAAAYGILLSALATGARVDIDALMRSMEAGPAPLAEDNIKLLALKARALAAMGRPAEAAAIFESLLAHPALGSETVLLYCDLLCALSRESRERALDLLERFERRFAGDTKFLHRLASLTFQSRRFDRAARLFEDLAGRDSGNRQYVIDAAQAFWFLGDRTKAQQFARKVLDPKYYALPGNPTDFWCAGFANWMIGELVRAEYDFERSGCAIAEHYSKLLPDRSV